MQPPARADPQVYEGCGTTTPGGEGGEIIHVTNQNDSGPGRIAGLGLPKTEREER